MIQRQSTTKQKDSQRRCFPSIHTSFQPDTYSVDADILTGKKETLLRAYLSDRSKHSQGVSIGIYKISEPSVLVHSVLYCR